jgi:cobalt/nickel transport system ATP-binding protein
VDPNHLILHLENISFNYPGGPKILTDLDLLFYKGDRIGLMGPNGSGKTTLFHIIMGLLKPCSGSMEIYSRPAKTEKDFTSVRKKIGLLFQDADDQLFSPTVLEDVAFGPLNLGKSRDEAMEISLKTLKFLGLSGFEDRITYKLSGGEKKLVSLATVLAMEPEVLLLDEPTSGLDDYTKATLKKVLADLDLSYIIISHEIDFLAETTDHIYAMENGKILFEEEIHPHQHVHAHPHGAYVHEHE